MAERYDPRRSQRTLDPDTPVCSLGDKRTYRREAIVLVSDEERDLWAEVVGRMRMMRERGVIQGERKAFWETTFGRVAIIAALVAGVADLVAQLYTLVHQ